MATFNKDMTKLAQENSYFQREVYLDKNIQIVLMSLEPGEDIGEETHRADQTTYFVAGTGQAVIDGSRTKVTANHMIVIPQGAKHNIINKGTAPLKLFSVYAPPAEDPGVAHRTKAAAEAAEEGVVSKAVKAVTKAAGDLKTRVTKAK
ncbi:cupin domain-containing protein [Sphingomonas sp. BIUV-7]|uniref:Cupin domain-containing protein n=1 Tax=Sphingomonas natans TaxID=3063330 RepID=A0ABT8Y9I1_9SPHN|nr:cupin domain-containing protein [Sphingomonas sp. BIUV-7]MDO6414992.1 cupin domain-containing protein [Sphingomonas sp. BIUV-7]